MIIYMFYGQFLDKPCTLRSTMIASGLSYQTSIAYWSIPIIFSLYISVFAGYKFRDVAYEKLPSLSSKKTLIFQLTKFLVLKPFSLPLSHDPNGVQKTGDLVR